MTNELNLEKLIGKNDVIQVDSTMRIVDTLDWMSAATKVISNDAYVLIPRSNGELLRSPSFSMPKPLVIGLNVFVPMRAQRVKMSLTDNVAKSKILIRDNYVCQYCGGFGNTIDHIMPKSRGGLNTWGNLCAACSKCNGSKSDMTPDEAGLKNPIINAGYVTLGKNNDHLHNALMADLSSML